MESSPSSSSSSSHQQKRLTVTQSEQLRVEEKVAEIYQVLNGVSPHTQSLILELWRDKHIEFLTRGLRLLGPSYHVLDANRPWLCYWILHSIALLGEPLDEFDNAAVDFLSRCEGKEGGYGGGPGQMAHLATTYAAVNSLITLGSDRALSSINREKMYAFLSQMKDPSGAFRMHDAGEMDVRACYTAISVSYFHISTHPSLMIHDMTLCSSRAALYILSLCGPEIKVMKNFYVYPSSQKDLMDLLSC